MKGSMANGRNGSLKGSLIGSAAPGAIPPDALYSSPKKKQAAPPPDINGFDTSKVRGSPGITAGYKSGMVVGGKQGPGTIV